MRWFYFINGPKTPWTFWQVVTQTDENRIHVDCPQGALYVNADYYMITQALKNIVHNALVHGPEGKEIDIHVRIMDQKIMISVIDQGEGISKETLNKIFDKFYRGAKTKKGGLGLGLSIARRFVQLNDGDVEAENLTPNGFMVTITLPMAEKE
jgi:two-component system sensor histidine kinase VicK